MTYYTTIKERNTLMRKKNINKKANEKKRRKIRKAKEKVQHLKRREKHLISLIETIKAQQLGTQQVSVEK